MGSKLGKGMLGFGFALAAFGGLLTEYETHEVSGMGIVTESPYYGVGIALLVIGILLATLGGIIYAIYK